MKKLFAVLVVMLATGFVAANADESYFADKPAPVALPSNGNQVAAKPEVRVSLADVAASRVTKAEEAHSKHQQAQVLVPDFVAW